MGIKLVQKCSLLKDRIGKTEALACILVLFVLFQAAYFLNKSESTKIPILLIMAVVLICGSLFLYRRMWHSDSVYVHKVLFPAVLAIMGLTSVFFFPAGTVPDEPYHFYRSYAYLETLVGADLETVRSEDAPLFSNGMLSADINESDWGYVKDHIFDSTDKGETAVEDLDGFNAYYLRPADLISDLPQQKLPSALGIGVGWILGLNHVATFYLGRIFNMFFGVVLIACAVRIAPVGKSLMMVAALFPMTLHLLGSYSYDTPIIGLSFLMTALVLKAFCEEKKLSLPFQVTTVALLACLAPCKVVYSLIGFTLLALPSKKFESKRKSWVFKAFLFFAPIAVILLIKLSSLVGLASISDGVDARGEETGVFWSLSDIIANPLYSASFFWGTIESLGTFWLLNIPGDSLGWFQANTSFPDYVGITYLFIMASAMIKSRDDGLTVPSVLRVCGIGAVAIGSIGVILSMWLGWTFISDAMIQGVQGRYFIPFLPLLFTCLRPNGIVLKYNSGFTAMMTICVLDLTCYMYIVSVAI